MTADGGAGVRVARVAVIGSGPAGIYTAQALTDPAAGAAVQVDVYDRLPVPYGLVRYGVAPDHPKIKSIIEQLRRVMERPAVRFLGNVRLGRDVTLAELRDLLRRGRRGLWRQRRSSTVRAGRGPSGQYLGHRVRLLVQRAP